MRKKVYTKEELNDLKAWFVGRKLPKTMQLGKSVFIPDVEDSLQRLFDQADVCFENPKMQGCLFMLEDIKSELEKLQA